MRKIDSRAKGGNLISFGIFHSATRLAAILDCLQLLFQRVQCNQYDIPLKATTCHFNFIKRALFQKKTRAEQKTYGTDCEYQVQFSR